MKLNHFALVLGSTLGLSLWATDNPSYPAPVCDTEFTCLQKVGECYPGDLRQDENDSRYIYSEALIPAQFIAHKICITYDGKTVRYTTTHIDRERYSGSPVYSDYLNKGPWNAAPEKIKEAQEKAVATCKLAHASYKFRLESEYVACP